MRNHLSKTAGQFADPVGREPAQARYDAPLARIARLAVEARNAQRLLQEIPRAAVEALDAGRAVVYLHDEECSRLQAVAAVGPSPGGGGDMDVHDVLHGLACRVIAEGRAWVVADGRESPFTDLAWVSWGSHSRVALGVPLFDGSRVIGVLAVCARGAVPFDGEDVRFLETLSDLLAASLQRAHSDEALRHSENLKSVGQLTAGIAHDFKNLLTVISGNLEVLQDLPAVAGDEGMRTTVDAAARAAKRGAELTGKLLAFARRQELHPAAVDVGVMLHPFADMLGRTLDQGIRVTVDVAPDCPECLVDPGQLESALLNLAINARDAMPDGGTLSFSARAAPDATPEAGAQTTAPSHPEYVAIAIADTGAGMTDAVKRRALDPFFTTKPAGHGTGLGLSTVYGFARQSRGTMVLDSTPGKGTTVTLFLPQHHGG